MDIGLLDAGSRPPRAAARRARRSAARRLAVAAVLCLSFPSAPLAATEYEVCVDVGADIRALGSDDAFEWEPASDRLSALGTAAWPALLRALEHEGPTVREGVINVLASSSESDDAVSASLARVARNDSEADVRASAVAALRKLAGAQSRDVVVAALDDPSPEVRRNAITACTDLCSDDAAVARLVELALGDPSLINALQARRVLWRATADGRETRVVEQIRAGAVATAVATSRTSTSDAGSPDLRDAAAPAPRASNAANAAAASRREILAALLLAEIGDASRLDTVVRATRSDEEQAIRIVALHALGRLGGEEQVALVAALQPDPAVGAYAHDALRRMSERGVASAAEAASRHTGPRAPQLLPRP